MNGDSGRSGTIRLVAMVTGLLVAPAITPALIWTTIAANLPLGVVITQLVALALISKIVFRRLFRLCEPIDSHGGAPAVAKSWSSEPANG
jgi:hypothetical protein